ncbi:hypothetical protein H3V53_07295 [Paraburkholderia bengalensis]|uniref:Uncharacterized protein n=1 Tax=Paraburkholderia bengalensis TaxID=2747562 RepID=A0ABU8INI0_9BURK
MSDAVLHECSETAGVALGKDFKAGAKRDAHCRDIVAASAKERAFTLTRRFESA